MESIQEARDQNLHVEGIFLDVAKAYDVLNHNTLLGKLNSYVIRGNMNLWFKSYLSNYSLFVEIIQTEHRNFTQCMYTSTLKKIVHFVPQGSILGHLLLLLCINNLPLNIQGVNLVLFADDTNDKSEDAFQQKVLYAVKELEVCLQKSDQIVNIEK